MRRRGIVLPPVSFSALGDETDSQHQTMHTGHLTSNRLKSPLQCGVDLIVRCGWCPARIWTRRTLMRMVLVIGIDHRLLIRNVSRRKVKFKYS